MDELSNGLIEALKQNLPEMQVKAVTNRLKEYDELKGKLERSELLVKSHLQSLEFKETEINELKDNLNKLNERISDFMKREESLKERELACETKERNWDKESLQIQLESQEKLNSTMFNLISQVFHSPVYQTSQQGFMNIRNNYNGMDRVPFEQIIRQEAVTPVDHKHIMNGNNSTNTQGSTGPVMNC
ncbi:hypothetical protein [Parabacteroides sp.]